MTVVEKLGAFFTRKRSLKYVIGGIAFVLIGHLIEGVAVLSMARGVTTWVESGLRAIQPFQVADAFFDATRGHRGLWFCAPVGAYPGSEGYCGSVIGLANAGLASAFAVPQVTGQVWENGGLISTILFVMTIAAMALIIMAGWSDVGKPDGGPGKAMLGTIAVLALGPLAAGAVFWALLHLLLVLVILVGTVLAGVAWCAATFGTVYKVCALIFGAVKSGDELQEKVELVTGSEQGPKS